MVPMRALLCADRRVSQVTPDSKRPLVGRSCLESPGWVDHQVLRGARARVLDETGDRWSHVQSVAWNLRSMGPGGGGRLHDVRRTCATLLVDLEVYSE